MVGSILTHDKIVFKMKILFYVLIWEYQHFYEHFKMFKYNNSVLVTV